MKKILQLTKAIILTLVAVIMLLNTNVLTAYAQVMLPGMTKTEYGIMVSGGTFGALVAIDAKTGTKWSYENYPYSTVEKTVTVIKVGKPVESKKIFLDCYLTDYIKTHDELEWPSFVMRGSDGVPFYLSEYGDANGNTVRFTKWCLDEATGWWLRDKAYVGPKVPDNGFNTADAEIAQIIEDLKEDIANGEEVNGTPIDPIIPDNINDVIDSDDAPTYDLNNGTYTYPDGRIEYPDGHVEYPDGRVEYTDKQHGDHIDKHIVYPDGHVEYYCGETIIRIEYPDGRVEYPNGEPEDEDPYADVNTLGATLTLKTDCIKVKKNNAPQKPLPKSVKIGKKALKRNKTFTVSYEKYTDDWHAVDAVTDEGIYRLVITGKNGYEGVYKKRLYVTAEKAIKAMSSVSVKVNKVAYTGKPIETGVIKTAKIGRRALTEKDDYTVTYKNNTDSGTGQIVLTAKEGSGLLGTKTVNFTITGNKMSKVKVLGIANLTYSPDTDLVQDMSNVKLTFGTAALVENTDFTVSYVNNTKAGKAKIVFTGKGLYYGTLTKTFKINKAVLSKDMLDETSKRIKSTHTSKAVKPEVTLKNGDTELKKGTDYTVTYKNNVKVSTDAKPAQIIVKGKGNYTGSFKVDFTIVAKDNDNTGKSNAKNIKPDAEDETIIDEPTEEEPATDEPTTEETVSDEPTEEEQATEEPKEDEPDAGDSTDEEAATDEPAGDEPSTDEPTEKEPVADKPIEDKPATNEPTEDAPATDEPTEDEPSTDEPTEDEPTEDEPVTDEPTEDNPATDNPTIDKPTADEAAETVMSVETTAQ